MFLLSDECAKGVLGPYSNTGARISNVLRASLGQKWGAVSMPGHQGRGGSMAGQSVLSMHALSPGQNRPLCIEGRAF